MNFLIFKKFINEKGNIITINIFETRKGGHNVYIDTYKNVDQKCVNC